MKADKVGRNVMALQKNLMPAPSRQMINLLTLEFSGRSAI